MLGRHWNVFPSHLLPQKSSYPGVTQGQCDELVQVSIYVHLYRKIWLILATFDVFLILHNFSFVGFVERGLMKRESLTFFIGAVHK